MAGIYWNQFNYDWNNNQEYWSYVIEAVESLGIRGNSNYRKLIRKLNKEEKRKLITILCKINGENYKKEISTNDYKITIEDLKQIEEEYKKVKIQLEQFKQNN